LNLHLFVWHIASHNGIKCYLGLLFCEIHREIFTSLTDNRTQP